MSERQQRRAQAEEKRHQQTRLEDEKTVGELLEVYSKEQMQRRLRSGCRISEWRRLEAEIGKDVIMSV